MDKRKEGRPGETRNALRRSVRENGYVLFFPSFFLAHMYVPKVLKSVCMQYCF